MVSVRFKEMLVGKEKAAAVCIFVEIREISDISNVCVCVFVVAQAKKSTAVW